MAIQYTYYPALKPDGSAKEGINRITWEDNGSSNPSNWTEITREYCPEDSRTQPSAALAAVLNATPEEIEQIRQILGIS